ncbi:MAG: hypothetical protein IJX17_06485 [Clostridia bacterium]|nr:hypothetical protein [Clostridia bacterium]
MMKKMNKLNKAIVICVECSQQYPSDSLYIDKILKHIYLLNETKINYIYLAGKGNYNSNKTIKKINKHLSNKKIITKIIYCLDTDNFKTSPEDAKLNKEIELFCISNNYELVWFCRDIEEVLINKRVSDSQKPKEAQKFQKANNNINSELISKLKHENINIKKSNFLNKFDKELIRK